MARIRATCEWCGDIDLIAQEVTIRASSADMSCSAVFLCPNCGRDAAVPFHRGLAPDLLDAGCGFEAWDVRGELEGPEAGPPITTGDVRAMHELLATPGWEQQIMSAAHSDERPPWRRRSE